jgi:hypothetical protein
MAIVAAEYLCTPEASDIALELIACSICLLCPPDNSTPLGVDIGSNLSSQNPSDQMTRMLKGIMSISAYESFAEEIISRAIKPRDTSTIDVKPIELVSLLSTPLQSDGVIKSARRVSAAKISAPHQPSHTPTPPLAINLSTNHSDAIDDNHHHTSRPKVRGGLRSDRSSLLQEVTHLSESPPRIQPDTQPSFPTQSDGTSSPLVSNLDSNVVGVGQGIQGFKKSLSIKRKEDQHRAEKRSIRSLAPTGDGKDSLELEIGCEVVIPIAQSSDYEPSWSPRLLEKLDETASFPKLPPRPPAEIRNNNSGTPCDQSQDSVEFDRSKLRSIKSGSRKGRLRVRSAAPMIETPDNEWADVSPPHVMPSTASARLISNTYEEHEEENLSAERTQECGDLGSINRDKCVTITPQSSTEEEGDIGMLKRSPMHHNEIAQRASESTSATNILKPSKDIYEYIATEDLAVSERPLKDLHYVVIGLHEHDWPQIFLTINLTRQLAVHHPGDVILSGHLHAIVLGINKQVTLIPMFVIDLAIQIIPFIRWRAFALPLQRTRFLRLETFISG